MAFLHFVLRGLCHQIPERALTFGQQVFPLCARCTGLYLGVALALLYLAGRGRLTRTQLPPLSGLCLSALSLGGMGLDGLASLARLWLSPAWLRLVNGSLAGAALAICISPLLAQLLWRTPVREPVIRRTRELVLLFLVVAALSLAASSGAAHLLGPMLALSLLGVGSVLVALNLVLGMVLTPWKGWAERLAGLGVPIMIAVIASGSELLVLALCRTVLATLL